MANDKYILGGTVVIPCPDLATWAAWFQTANRIVKRTQISDVAVSTAFLGLDHRFGEDGPPLVFETMIFGGAHDGHQMRCSTWLQAEAQHGVAEEMVRTA